MQLAIAAIIALLPIINPFSTAPMFLAITEGDTEAERREQARKAVIYMVCILVAFLVGGSFIMTFFGLSLPGLRIAGGILVAGVGMRMLYPKDNGVQTKAEHLESKRKRDVSFTPLAMPSLAGPGAISVTIGLTSLAKGWLDFVSIIIGILAVAAIVYLTLRLSTRLVKILGVNGLHAMTKIMGFLILCVGVQFIVNGVIDVASSPELVHGILRVLEEAR
ncbi:MarC family NAAT transporter [Pseudomonas sp. MYb185]|uniref:MarC family NAAT transporter n=1 Tax=Pseudomonas sp. MYb185 TaxID=1848729 RepID=UPI000CFC3D26|nr:MarC family NAAT transporter [Pseudomonas sp. MYb185]PRB77532.1 stress protection protein MarC [Pseudomonas sp. MYb185]